MKPLHWRRRLNLAVMLSALSMFAGLGRAEAQSLSDYEMDQAVLGSQSGAPPILPLGDEHFSGWTGLAGTPDGAALLLSGAAEFRYPAGKRGWFIQGFRQENDGTRDWRPYFGLQAAVWVPAGRAVVLKATIFTPATDLRQDYLPESSATITVNGGGWRHVNFPWSLFDFTPRRYVMLKYIRGVRFDAEFAPTSGTAPHEAVLSSRSGPSNQFVPENQLFRIKNVRLIRAPQISLAAPVRGEAVEPGQSAAYDVNVGNCTDVYQDVTLSVATAGFEVMTPQVVPDHMTLAPGAQAVCRVTVTVPADGVPPGGHETEVLEASGNGGAALANLEFTTARGLDQPSLLFDDAGWAAIRDKVKNYDWAKQQADAFIKVADDWSVPEAALPPNNYSVNERHVYVFPNQSFVVLPQVAYAYQLTGDRKYAEKVALYLNRLCDPVTGYPSTMAGTNEGGPQEGQNFQAVAIAYDAIREAGVLTDADRAKIAHTFRLYMETMEPNLTVGNMGNWSVAQSTACLMCALSLGDLEVAKRYLYGPEGWTDFLSKGVMNDGWWWECSTGYNLWVAAELTQAALAVKPWGIDLINLNVPANYARLAMSQPWGEDPPYGTSFEKWGPNTSNTRSLKQFWDALPRATDYRGVVFGMNDGHESKVGGQGLEMAYYVYRDPAYATFIKQSGTRDLLYGVPDLPADTPKLYANSSTAENIGYALLRSQTPGREPRDQIQAVLKIGTQGGFHGHFDRTSLDNLTRYGRSFWEPETIWWGYPNFMYKFFVQTSDASNMVVVDQKQQEAVPSTQLLFHSGPMIQVAAQETNARWSDPPYGGMQYFPGDTFASQMKKNQQSIPLATDREYGELGPYTDRVLQRRMAVVTDDYVVIADYLKSGRPHTFDDLWQMKSLQSLDAPDKTFLRHDAQFSTDPHSAAQFITDANWYTASAPSKARFLFEFGPGADNSGTTEYCNDPGKLFIDVYGVWPPKQELMLATAPETQGEQQWVTYQVSGDEKVLTHGETGTWILGSADVDVPVSGIQNLALSLTTTGTKKKALFWVNPRLVLADGSEVPLTAPTTQSNVDQPAQPGKDYYGGPIKIAGNEAVNPLPAQPLSLTSPSELDFALAGKNAVRFKATLGGDFPFGEETARRKVYSVRTEGTEANFLTVLEPFETAAVVKSAVATGPGQLHVELTDGRSQDITITGLDGDGKSIAVKISESINGQVVRSETASSGQ